MMKLKKKRIFQIVLLFLFIGIGLIKCSLPTFIMSPYDIHGSSINQILSTERSVWYYKPLMDTLIIKDSLRDIRFYVKEACAYDNRWASSIFFEYYLPWINLYEDNERKLFGIWFDYMDLYNKYSKSLRFTYELDSASNRLFSGGTALDNKKKKYSYYGGNINYPLPDTIRFVVTGNPHLYMERSTFRALSDKEQMDIIEKSMTFENERKVMGVITFIKGDSIIVIPSRDHFGRKLLYKSPQDM